MKVAEQFNTKLYANTLRSGHSTEATVVVRSLVTREKLGKTFKGMKRGKASGQDSKTVDHSEEGGDIVLEELAKLFSESFRT